LCPFFRYLCGLDSPQGGRGRVVGSRAQSAFHMPVEAGVSVSHLASNSHKLIVTIIDSVFTVIVTWVC
jgi:hypothetical protein